MISTDINIVLPEITLAVFAMAALMVAVYGGKDKLAGLMTTADISKAQAMARECMSSDYKNCGY